jgi:hypothetical protein
MGFAPIEAAHPMLLNRLWYCRLNAVTHAKLDSQAYSVVLPGKEHDMGIHKTYRTVSKRFLAMHWKVSDNDRSNTIRSLLKQRATFTCKPNMFKLLKYVLVI